MYYVLHFQRIFLFKPFLVGTNLPLTFAPENGHMLGGTMVNLTGPCFQPMMRITCRFNTKDSEGIVIDENRWVVTSQKGGKNERFFISNFFQFISFNTNIRPKQPLIIKFIKYCSIF